MDNRTELGMNRTGMQMSPKAQGRMLELTEMTQPSSAGDEGSLDALRAEYIAESDPVGSMPPPATIKGALKSGVKALTGVRAHVFLDKLGERLAYERSGTRLYAAFIGKCEATQDLPDVISVERLRHFQQEEMEHFMLVKECIEQLGGDPTAQTPCADVTGVASMGLLQVITDPQTNVNQALHAILVAELTDGAAWDELVALARDAGQEDMATRFEAAAQHESEHLETVKEWHLEATLQEARVSAH